MDFMFIFYNTVLGQLTKVLLRKYNYMCQCVILLYLVLLCLLVSAKSIWIKFLAQDFLSSEKQIGGVLWNYLNLDEPKIDNW